MMLKLSGVSKITIGEVVKIKGYTLQNMQYGQEEEYITSEFSNNLKNTYDWFDSRFTNIVAATFAEFWGFEPEVKLMSVSENTNLLAERDEFFVTQIRLNRELSVFIRLSKKFVKSLLENVLGANGKTFNIDKLTDLEAKILTGFDDFLYQNFCELVKSGEALPEGNNNYNECNLTFFVRVNKQTLGRIVIKIPVAAIDPLPVETIEERFTISDFENCSANVNLSVGTTRIRLNDLKTLEKDDIVVLENSKSSMMTLRYDNHSIQFRVVPNPAIMSDYEHGFDESPNGAKGDKTMPGSDMYNMWDTIQVEINAEFEKVKLTLGELKQISEGLVVDIGSVYDNKIDLKVEDKIVASGELIIINDRYGVKINQIFTEEKNQASQNAQYSEEQYYEEPAQPAVQDEVQNEPQQNYEEQPLLQNENSEVNEEDFDYSDFDVDEDDL